MARTSNSKIIYDQDKYKALLPKYVDVLDKLISKYPAVDGSTLGNLVNFQENKDLAKHRWLDYKQGYADGLVRSIIGQASIPSGGIILDPFCGVGTTNLTAQSMGYSSVGLDINPIAILTAEVKTHYYSESEIQEIENTIKDLSIPLEEYKMPESKVLSTSFTPKVYKEFLRIRKFVDSIPDGYIQKFFRLCLISIIDCCSLKVKDGNGLKIKKNPPQIDSVIRIFKEKAIMMITDIKSFNVDLYVRIKHGSSLDENTYSDIKNIDLCLFSPPYANCFDYCEVYKLELWISGFVNNYSDFEKYRAVAMRSHVNSKFDHRLANSFEDVEIISEMIRTFNVWNKNIPDMIKGYFDDTKKVLSNIFGVLKKGSSCYVVVANSAYKGNIVPTDLLIAEIAETLGYKVNRLIAARKIRSSSQQMNGFGDKYNFLMRESIVELLKL